MPTDDIFSGLVGSNFEDVVDFQDYLLPAVWNFVPVNVGAGVRDVTIHLYGTVAFDDGTSDIFDVERNSGESNSYVPNTALVTVTEQSDTNLVLNSIINPINDGAVTIDSGVGRSWNLSLVFLVVEGDKSFCVHYFLFTAWDLDYNILESTVYRSTDGGVSWQVCFSSNIDTIFNIVDFGWYLIMLDSQNSDVNGVSWELYYSYWGDFSEWCWFDWW